MVLTPALDTQPETELNEEAIQHEIGRWPAERARFFLTQWIWFISLALLVFTRGSNFVPLRS